MLELQDNLSAGGVTGTAFHLGPKMHPCGAINDSAVGGGGGDGDLFGIRGTPVQYPTALAECLWKLKINRFSCSVEWKILQKRETQILL